MIIIEVPGPPIGKGRLRHRVVRSRANPMGFASGYTPAKTRDYEARIRQAAVLAMRGRSPLEGPVELTVIAYMPIPVSWSAKKKAQALDEHIRPVVKPDGDNIAKSALDGANGIVFRDDAQVVDGHTHKFYDANPRLVIVACNSQKGNYHHVVMQRLLDLRNSDHRPLTHPTDVAHASP